MQSEVFNDVIDGIEASEVVLTFTPLTVPT